MPPKKKTCTHPGCDRPHLAKGWCSIHWARNRNGTDMDAPIGASRRKNELAEASADAPPRQQRGGDVIKRFRRLGQLLGLDPVRLLREAQEECARSYLDRIQAAAAGVGPTRSSPASWRTPPSTPATSSRSGMVLAPLPPTDEEDSPRRSRGSAKDLKSGSAECEGCGGVVTCSRLCPVGRYERVTKVATVS